MSSARAWVDRGIEAATTYLPLLLMAMLALGTWWLVKSTPLFDAGRPEVAPRHVADYTMNQFTVQRFARDGALRGQIEGDVLRHFPDTDTLEIDNPRIRAIGRDGQITRASAKRALSNKDGSELQLLGEAHVIREPFAGKPAVDFRGEFLHAFLDAEQVRSHLPVVVTQGATVMHAAGLNYDNLAGLVDLKGPVRAVFETARRPARKLP